ncbi:hypothetical protein B0O99DRAFT_693748 [Bisporella sp. PMI_857]|nr:hypothetical protein B0O99DRAFT_693748 [Bisporella sp. PMI_857]
MTKLVVVVGATGGQGGSVVSAFLKDSNFRVRGVTRNPNSEKARALAARGVEIVVADQKDPASLEKAFEDAHVIFTVTDYYEHFFDKGKDASMAIETEYGTNMANAAAKVPTLERYIWSTLPHTSAITSGQAIVPHFEGKGRVDTYIRENLPDLLSKTTFAIFTIFSMNLISYPIFYPIYLKSAKKWVQFYPTDPGSVYPSLGDHTINSGTFVHAIVRNPPPNGGTYVRCNVEDLTLDSYLEIWGRASGISPEPGSTKVVEISSEHYIQLWGHMGEEQASQWIFFKWLKAAGLSKIQGVEMIDGKELMTAEEIKSLVTTEDSLKGMDWSWFERPKL